MYYNYRGTETSRLKEVIKEKYSKIFQESGKILFWAYPFLPYCSHLRLVMAFLFQKTMIGISVPFICLNL